MRASAHLWPSTWMTILQGQSTGTSHRQLEAPAEGRQTEVSCEYSPGGRALRPSGNLCFLDILP